MKNFATYIFALFLLLLTGSCKDDLLYRDIEIGDGESFIDATVNFYPNVESLSTKSTPGNTIENINNLSIIIYDQYKSLHKVYNSINGDFQFTSSTHDKQPSMSDEDYNNGGQWSSQPQASASFKLPEKLPYGKYYIYCVANMGEIDEDDVDSIEKLQNISVEWNSNNIAENNQMFGYFTSESESDSDKPIAGFDADAVYITKNVQPIHAWIKRVASKITVAYDGSGLYQDVYIYIRKVTVKDIPSTCLLGADNKPVPSSDGISPLIENGESIFYNNSGIVNDGTNVGSDFQEWLTITNNGKILGSHAYDAPSMFFYENMQGDYENNPDKSKYNKQPQYDDVKDFLDELEKNPDAQPSSFDTKDNVPMGTYIEVEGYYLSQNKENIGSGPIKYRFMLGKNTTYNFNAQRNHHYKVTLKFHGWANQPEWHIDYVEENPGLYVPDRFYMPYLYNQKADFPVKLNGKCKSLKMEIVENAWGPRLPYDGSKQPAETVNATGDNPGAAAGMPLSYYNFVWNYEVWQKYNGRTWPSLGFLALTKPSDNPPANILMNYSFTDQLTGYNALKTYYEGKGEGNTLPQNVRTLTYFSKSGMLNTSDNNYSINRYEVIRTDSHGCDLLVPLFTRPKSMIHGTDYSGNNPHEYYVRYAKLKITAIFMTSAGEKTVEKIVDIYQVPRITNPKAVWKEAGSTESFDVLLTTRINGGGNADFTGFPSDGSWTAEIDKTGQYSNFSLEGNGGSYISTSPTMIEGRTGSEVKFRVKFNGAAAACGIITIRYNGGTCIHKIFLRQGFEPMQVTTNGAYWCSYNVYSSTGAFNTNGDKTVDAKLVKSPMSIGSLFRKGNYEQGILIKNNNKWGALVDGPYNFALSNGKYSSWDNISYTSSRYYYYKGTLYSPNYNWQWAKFKAEDGKTYRVPSYNEYQDITNNCDFGFGSLYGNGATETKTRYIEAIGYMDENGSTTSSPYGVRGVIVYNNRNANQIFFSMGKFGQGRRTRFNLQGNTEGVLRYGDVTNLLPNVTTEGSINNQFRPIPYNLGHQPGSVYWIRGIDYRNVTASNGNDTGGWDINYFSLNFSEYTNNCYGDALPIKLVLDR